MIISDMMIQLQPTRRPLHCVWLGLKERGDGKRRKEKKKRKKRKEKVENGLGLSI